MKGTKINLLKALCPISLFALQAFDSHIVLIALRQAHLVPSTNNKGTRYEAGLVVSLVEP